MEILKPEQFDELEKFVQGHPNSCFTQSPRWRFVKSNWGYEAVVSRDDNGHIRGAISLLVQKIPYIGTSFLYAPRGPVCDMTDMELLKDLKSGVDVLAKKHNAHVFKMDPDVLFSDEAAVANAKALGFTHEYGPDGFEGVQARFNYRLYLQGRNEEEMLAAISQSARRKVRIAQRAGVEVRPVGAEYLDDFIRIMRITGERDGFSTRPKVYFERMLEALGQNVRLYMAFYEGKPIAGAITTNYGGKVCYVYGASDNESREVMPNYLMQWEMIRWAVETGAVVYDFQGVSGILEESHHMYGLYKFKKGFNGTLDELAGEFIYTYKPFKSKLVDKAIALQARLRKMKNR